MGDDFGNRKFHFDCNASCDLLSSCDYPLMPAALDGNRVQGNALDILNTVDVLLQDDECRLEPTPINTDPGSVRVVSQVSVEDDSAWYWNDDMTSDVIDVLLQQQRQSPSLVPKRSRDFPDDSYSSNHRISKKPRAGSVQPSSSSSPLSPSSAASRADTTTPRIPAETPDKDNQRFRAYQAEQWWERFQDMIVFQRTYGHCCVPNTFPPNPNLAQWVKRQRYQYKLKREGKHSTLTDEREATLRDMGFIWDSHGAAWMERWNELAEFRSKNGHSNVPTNYPENRQLAIWVKCQRRQYKLYVSGSRSNMTEERIAKLESLGFVWNPRAAKDAKSSN